MFKINFDGYTIYCHPDQIPDIGYEYSKRAILFERFGIAERENSCFVAIGKQEQWPRLVVFQNFGAVGYGFYPGCLIVPETGVVFIGAGTRLLAYELTVPSRLWEDETDCGFFRWNRYGDVILMSAELELAAWNIHGLKLWTKFVEPQWHYEVENEQIVLDVMGEISTFSLFEGPSKER